MDYSYKAFSEYMVSEENIIYEVQLQHLWKNIPLNKKFYSTENDEVMILSPGLWNREAGPDFLNAKISINNKIVVGDVEIHTRTSEWYNHGHDKDSNYNNVILHVIADNNRLRESSPPITAMVITIPSEYKCEDIEKYNSGKCADYYSRMSSGQLKTLFTTAGLERFEAKSSKILKQMLNFGADYAMWESIFEAVGYKNNKDNFVELYHRFFNYPDNYKSQYTDSIIWGESGLLPDITTADIDPNMQVYVKKLWDDWWSIRPELHIPIQWKRSGIRPLNSPERRIAALIILIQKFSSPIEHFSSIVITEPVEYLWKILRTELSVNHDLWDSYTHFSCKRKGRAAVLGESRVLDLSINVILPAVNAYSRLIQNEQLGKKVRECWLALPKAQNNYILSIVRKKWFLEDNIADKIIKSAAVQQGILHVFKTFCEANQTDCNSCLIVNSGF